MFIIKHLDARTLMHDTALFNLVYSLVLFFAVADWLDTNKTLEFVRRISDNPYLWGSIFLYFGLINFSVFFYKNNIIISAIALLTGCYMLFFGILVCIGSYHMSTTSTAGSLCVGFSLLAFIACVKMSGIKT